MIVKTPTSLFRIRDVYSLVVMQKNQVKVVQPWRWYVPWQAPVTEEVERWELNMTYLSEDEQKMTTGWTCGVQQPLLDLYENIVKQVKAQDHEIVDRAFEDAVNNLGKK